MPALFEGASAMYIARGQGSPRFLGSFASVDGVEGDGCPAASMAEAVECTFAAQASASPLSKLLPELR